jgi:serine/threonine protein kinase
VKVRDLPHELSDQVRLVQLIAESERSEIYRGILAESGTSVAVKILKGVSAGAGEKSEDDLDFDRLRHETRILASVQSPNIARPVTTGRSKSGEPYLASELLSGLSVTQALRFAELLTLSRVVHIGLQIARALHAAHQVGVLHRALRPDNVFLIQEGDDPFFVKVMNFGLAKTYTAANAPTTGVDLNVGKVAYLTPEQIRGDEVDVHSDVYALGTLLFLLATRSLPFEKENAQDLIGAILNDAHEHAGARAPGLGIPSALSALIARCLAKDPVERPRSVEEVAIGLVQLGLPQPEPANDYAREVLYRAREQHFEEQPTGVIPIVRSSLSDEALVDALDPGARPSIGKSIDLNAKTAFDLPLGGGADAESLEEKPGHPDTLFSARPFSKTQAQSTGAREKGETRPFSEETLAMDPRPELDLSLNTSDMPTALNSESGAMASEDVFQAPPQKNLGPKDTAFDAKPYVPGSSSASEDAPTELSDQTEVAEELANDDDGIG